MKVFIEKKNKNLNMKFRGTAFNLLKKLKMNPEEVMLVKNNGLVTLDELLDEDDNIKILSVVSGG